MANNLIFRQAADQRWLYPRLVHHGVTAFSSSDVMLFLGRRIPLSCDLPKSFSGGVLCDLKHHQGGVHIKHGVNGNSLKLYDKAFTVVGSVLRVEATSHNGNEFRVYRPKQGDPEGELAWRVMRRGIADLHRQAEVSRKAAGRKAITAVLTALRPTVRQRTPVAA